MSIEVAAIGRANIDVSMSVDKLPKQAAHIISKGGHISVGGSATNFAMQSARLGVKTGLVSCIGNDPYGQMVQKDLAKIGVDTKSMLVLDKQQTGLFFAVTDSSNNSMIFVEPGANRFLDKHSLDEEYIARARTIHVAGGFPMMTTMAADIATTNGLILSLDPGRAAWSVDYSKVLLKTDLLFVNQKELVDYFKINPTKTALKAFAKTFPGIVIVKQGTKGAIATDGFEYCTSAVFEVSVADTLGAGDAFAAGFITAWSRSERIQQALNVANAVAALTITKKGAQNGQPSLDETSTFMKDHGLSIDGILRTFRSGKQRKSRRSA
ncbi:MAG: PfkB family carbohydrate kinase [Candidatus Thorarchaeota archaeon]